MTCRPADAGWCSVWMATSRHWCRASRYSRMAPIPARPRAGLSGPGRPPSLPLPANRGGSEEGSRLSASAEGAMAGGAGVAHDLDLVGHGGRVSGLGKLSELVGRVSHIIGCLAEPGH